MASVHTIRLKPAQPHTVNGCDLDVIALEFEAETGLLEGFRIELGSGYFIYWVLPAGPGAHLRRFHTGIVAVEWDPTLEDERFFFDYGPETWTGELGRVGPGRDQVVESVELEVGEAPEFYRCRARVRQPDGAVMDHVLVYRQPE